MAQLGDDLVELIKTLHSVWAAAVDTGSVSDKEYEEIMDQGEAVLAKWGVKV